MDNPQIGVALKLMFPKVPCQDINDLPEGLTSVAKPFSNDTSHFPVEHNF